MTAKPNGKINIYDIIKKEKLDAVNKPIAKAHGLPNECYNNVKYTELERKKLFEDKWVVVGVASSIPKPGFVGGNILPSTKSKPSVASSFLKTSTALFAGLLLTICCIHCIDAAFWNIYQ